MTTIVIKRKKRCGKHMLEERAFCALDPGHEGDCSKFPVNQGVRLPEVITEVRARLASLRASITQLEKYENEYLGVALVSCMGSTAGSPDGCGTLLLVKELVYIQTYWYTQPYGCTGGDYWNLGEGQFVCPKCSILNRLYERPEVVKLKSFFKEIKKTHDR